MGLCLFSTMVAQTKTPEPLIIPLLRLTSDNERSE